MADQQSRQPFRFWLPWLASAPRPVPVESQPPTQPLTTPLPIQRPPFRPPGIAPSQSQAPRTESQPSSPSRTAPPSRAASQPSSPLRAAPQSRTASQPSTPSRAAPQPRAASQPSSPSHTTPSSRDASQPSSPSHTTPPSQAPSHPSSPSRTASQPQPATRVASQPPSPSHTASPPPSPSKQAPQIQSTTRKSSRPPPSKQTPQQQPTAQASIQLSPSHKAFQPPSPSRLSASQNEAPSDLPSHAETVASQAPSQVTQTPQQRPTAQASIQLSPSRKAFQPPSPSRLSASQNEAPSDLPSRAETVASQAPSQVTQPLVTSQTDTVAEQPSQISDSVATGAPTSAMALDMPAQPQTLYSSAAKDDLKHPSKLEIKPEEANDGMQKIDLEPKEKLESKAPASEEPKQRTITKLLNMIPDSNKPTTRDQLGITSRAEQEQLEKQAVIDEKEAASTEFKEKYGKTAITGPTRDRTAGSETRQKSPTSNVERTSRHKEIREDVSRLAYKLAVGHPKQVIDTNSVSVITMAGENKGAIMHIGYESEKRETSLHIHRGYKLNQDDKAETTNDEGSSSRRKLNDSNTTEDSTTATYTNSNVQSINNSIMFNSPINERNPGVHLALTHNPMEPIKSNGKTKSTETHKVDFNITPAQKLTYEPKVRRRCLRGMFMESSDSDPDNPEKPRRHGCRYSCEEKKGRADGERTSMTKG